MKKAQGLPITTVILATLGLLVLLVLFAIVTGRLAWFGLGVQTCPGTCVSADLCSSDAGYVLYGDFLDPSTKQKCASSTVCCAKPPKSK